MSDQTNIKIQSDIQQLLARSRIYQLLSFFYRDPISHPMSLPLSLEEREKWTQAVHTIVVPDRVLLKDSFDLLMKKLDQMNFQEWNREYESFFGHTVRGPVPDYELEYGDENSHRQPQVLGDIAAFYRAFGLEPNRKVHERVDHISVECEFMHFLLYKEAYALQFDHSQEKAETCHRASCRFLEEHLGCWVPSFALRLAKHTKEGLMKYLADFTKMFVVGDCQQIGITTDFKELSLRLPKEEEPGCMGCSLEIKEGG